MSEEDGEETAREAKCGRCGATFMQYKVPTRRAKNLAKMLAETGEWFPIHCPPCERKTIWGEAGAFIPTARTGPAPIKSQHPDKPPEPLRGEEEDDLPW